MNTQSILFQKQYLFIFFHQDKTHYILHKVKNSLQELHLTEITKKYIERLHLGK